MEQLPESFARAATKQRFQDLVSGRSRLRKTSSVTSDTKEEKPPLSPSSDLIDFEDKVTVLHNSNTYDVPFSPTSDRKEPELNAELPSASLITADQGDLQREVDNASRSSASLISGNPDGFLSSARPRQMFREDSVESVSPIAYVERRVTSQSQLSPLSHSKDDSVRTVDSRREVAVLIDRPSQEDPSNTAIQMTDFSRIKSPSNSVISVQVENEMRTQPPVRPRRRKDSSLTDARAREVIDKEELTPNEAPQLLYRKRRQPAISENADVKSSSDSLLISYDETTTRNSINVPERSTVVDPLDSLPKDSQETRLSRLRSKVLSAQELMQVSLAGGLSPTKGLDNQNRDISAPILLPTKQQQDLQNDTLPEDILGLKIHRTDKLVGNLDLSNLLVRLSIVDGKTGKFLPKSTTKSDIGSEVELDCMMPVMTSVCDLFPTELPFPSWEEILVFNEDFHNFFRNPEAVMFFELCTFKPFGNVAGEGNKEKSSDPFCCIAWAFLRLSSSTMKMAETQQRIRLQLFKPGKALVSKSSPADIPYVYRWWDTKHHSKYPSTLHVTLMKLPFSSTGPRPDALVYHTESRPEPLKAGDASSTIVRSMDSPLTFLPDGASFSIEVSPQGVSVVRFSKDGRSLACGGLENVGLSCIKIYEIPGGTLKGVFRQLRGIVYSLEWSPNSDVLLCASADGTVKLWNTVTFHTKPLISFPHPGFVYCALFHPKSIAVVVSGCYDGTIRIWSTDVEKSTYALLQELTGHIGLINVITFSPNGDQLYSGGSDGLIRQWKQDTSTSAGSPLLFEYRITNTTPTGLSQNVIIVDIKIRSEAKQLVCISQNGELSFVDLDGFVLSRQISFSQPFKYRIRGTLTPDEKYLYVGSVGSEIQIVDLDSAKVVRTMTSHLSSGVPVDIDHHPTQDTIVLCALGTDERVVIRLTGGRIREDLTSRFTHRFSSANVSSSNEQRVRTSINDPAQSDKVIEVIRKLDAITDDMKQRERLRSGKELFTHAGVKTANRGNSRLPDFALQQNFSYNTSPNGLQSKLAVR